MKQNFSDFVKSLTILLIVPTIYANEYCAVSKDHLLCKDPNTIFPACIKHRSFPITEDLKREIVQSVNEFRNGVAIGNVTGFGEEAYPNAANMLEMVWDDNLALTAQSVANKCHFSHSCNICRSFENNTRSAGENLAMLMLGIGPREQELNWEAANTMFYNEAKYLNVSEVESMAMSHFQQDPSPGHFTQLVWANSYLIGCAATGFTKGQWQNVFYVCHYGPAGNMIGAPIYKIGPTCSSCPQGTSCSKNYEGLCSSDNLPKIKSTPINYAPVTNPEIEELQIEIDLPKFNISSNDIVPLKLSELFIIVSRLEEKLDKLLSLNIYKRKA